MKVLAWFQCFLPQIDSVFIIHEDTQGTIPLVHGYLHYWLWGCNRQRSPPHPVPSSHPLTGAVHMPLGSSAVALFQAGRGRDSFFQASAREIWLTSAAWDITLAMGHLLVRHHSLMYFILMVMISFKCFTYPLLHVFSWVLRIQNEGRCTLSTFLCFQDPLFPVRHTEVVILTHILK